MNSKRGVGSSFQSINNSTYIYIGLHQFRLIIKRMENKSVKGYINLDFKSFRNLLLFAHLLPPPSIYYTYMISIPRWAFRRTGVYR